MAEETEKVSSSSSSQQSEIADIKSQTPISSGFRASNPYGDTPIYPFYYPSLVPGLNPEQYEEHTNRGAGIYAVSMHQFTGHFSGLPSNNLIPLTYNIPTTRPSNEAVPGGENQAQGGQHEQGQQQPVHQRQIIERRFQIAFQLDLFLILKLACVIFLFNQDGSRQRLVVLVIFASIIYLYQTGALAPLVRWLSQGMNRAAIPPRPLRPVARPDNDQAAARPLNQDAIHEGQDREENEVRVAGNENRANVDENENVVEPDAAGEQGNQWWGIVKEIQMIVFGFITSLLPGFHNID